MTAALVGLLLGGWFSVSPEAQPFSAQIVRALRYYGLTSPGVFSGSSVTVTGTATVGATGGFCWTTLGCVKSPSDGVITLLNAAGTDFTRLQLGGTTSSFPALKRSGSQLQARLADDSALTTFVASNFNIGVGAGQYQFSGGMFAQNTPPTVTSAGSSPTVPNANGSLTFRVNVGTGGTATTIVLALPTAATGWDCNGSNITAAAANRNPTGVLLQQSSTTTAATIQYQTPVTGVALAFTASDIVQISCLAF